MKNRNLLFIFLLLLLFILVACQTNETSEKTINTVSYAEANTFGEVNSDFLVIYEGEEEVAVFEEVIEKAVKQEDTDDMSDPGYDFEVLYTDETTRGYHLWLGEASEISTLMDIEDTHTIYHIPSELNNDLIDLIK